MTPSLEGQVAVVPLGMQTSACAASAQGSRRMRGRGFTVYAEAGSITLHYASNGCVTSAYDRAEFSSAVRARGVQQC